MLRQTGQAKWAADVSWWCGLAAAGGSRRQQRRFGGGGGGLDRLLAGPAAAHPAHAAALLWNEAAARAGPPANEWESAAKLLSVLPMVAARSPSM